MAEGNSAWQTPSPHFSLKSRVGVFCLFSQRKMKKKIISLRLLPVDAPCCDTLCKAASVMLKAEHERDSVTRGITTQGTAGTRNAPRGSALGNPIPGKNEPFKESPSPSQSMVPPWWLFPLAPGPTQPFPYGKKLVVTQKCQIRGEVLPSQDQAREVFPASEVENRLRLSEQTCYLTVYKIFEYLFGSSSLDVGKCTRCLQLQSLVMSVFHCNSSELKFG